LLREQAKPGFDFTIVIAQGVYRRIDTAEHSQHQAFRFINHDWHVGLFGVQREKIFLAVDPATAQSARYVAFM